MADPRFLEVDTDSGRVAGAIEPGGRVRSWKGIPYAAPPVGALRWRPPQPCARWAGARPALQYGADFPQAANRVRHAPGMSEDCLFLNVWSPVTAPAAGRPGLPVMVWLHGGGFVGGSGADARTEGQHLAARGVVVVSFNYRSGLFGWLAHPALSEEAQRLDGVRTSGNYGLLDQMAALRWVQRNVAAFGGDPGRVTTFGVSAGSASIALLLTLAQAEGLFHQAILHSPGTARPLAGLAQAEATGLTLGDDLDALRALDGFSLFSRTGHVNPAVRGLTTPRVLRPIRDGHLVEEDERAVFLAARQRRMPVIVGTNADEGSLLTSGWPVATAAEARALIEANFPRAVQEALAFYGAADDAQARACIARAFGDTQFNDGARLLLRTMSRVEPRSFGYRFTRRRPGCGDGPHHGDEAAYVFGHLGVGRTAEPEPFDATDTAVSEALARAWVAFAAHGDPNGEGLPPWPAYALADERWLEFGDGFAPVANPHTARLDFLDRYLDAT